ncbi:GNAT family N-acetyltransferase [Mesorhizobium newzealandense]|uniref:GNAT family N-acetyltransferase n=1 Tax=Mesorhizobium newzealandense TaxID=1300302 RepID=A0ABW4U8J1_9HYPH
MTVPILEAMNIRLRPPCEADASSRLLLGRDMDIARMFGASLEDVRPITEEDAARWLKALAEHHYAWVIEHQGSFIGEIRLDGVDIRDRRASMAIGIFDPASLGRGLGSQAIMLLLKHAFGQMQLHRIGIRVLAYNKRAIRAYEKCGFVVEGRERESALVDGVWYDDLMMSLLAHEFHRKTESFEIDVRGPTE